MIQRRIQTTRRRMIRCLSSPSSPTVMTPSLTQRNAALKKYVSQTQSETLNQIINHISLERKRDPQMPGLADMSDNSSHTAKCWSQSQNTWSRNHCRTQTRRCWVIIQQKCFKIHFAGFTMETCNWVALAILTDWIEKFKRWGQPEINLKNILI